MCCKNEFHNVRDNQNNPCFCKMESMILSKKKRVELLKNYLTELQEKESDIKETIKELEA
jgi:hypothetical protein